jgi:ppGpp synthetase/RelA/SpoT-type nucleotidyltranferase
MVRPPFLKVLQRQIRHIAYEFVRLKKEHVGLKSEEAGRQRKLVSRRLMEFYREALWRGHVTEVNLLEATKLGEETLREIHSLRGTEHFFSKTLDAFHKSLRELDVDHDDIDAFLTLKLHQYRQSRDKEESLFLKDYHAYRDQLLAIINDARAARRLPPFEVQNRIKRELLAKIQDRKWKDMQRFFDLVGLRIIVGNQREVDAAVALVEGALKVHEAEAITNREVAHYFKIAKITKKNNKRGYRATHIDVRRFTREDGNDHPTAEIQVMSRGIWEWGKIQRLIVYKAKQIPKEVKKVISNYCRAAADCIVAFENGRGTDRLPDPDILALNRIPDEALRENVFDRICDMDALVTKYHDKYARPAPPVGDDRPK